MNWFQVKTCHHQGGRTHPGDMALTYDLNKPELILYVLLLQWLCNPNAPFPWPYTPFPSQLHTVLKEVTILVSLCSLIQALRLHRQI